MQVGLPAALAQQAVERLERAPVVRDVHPRKCRHLPGRCGLHVLAVLAEEGGPVAHTSGRRVPDRAADDRPARTVGLEDPPRPALGHDAVVLDHRDVRSLRGRDPRRAELGHGHRAVEREQAHVRPALADAGSRLLVGPVGDDDFRLRRIGRERGQTLVEVRHPVHRGDDDRQLGLSHARGGRRGAHAPRPPPRPR